MKIKKNNKKGFTIVELVIVIAVIGILAAILIPTFISLNNKARMANTESFLKNINTQIAMKEANDDLDDVEVGGFNTMHAGVEYARSKGFDLEEISPFAGNEIVWDEANHRFAFVNGTNIVYSEVGFDFANAQYMPDTKEDLVAMVTDTTNPKKVYAKAKLENLGELNIKNSFDAGNNTSITTINYANSVEQEVIIRTNGGLLNINAPADDVHHYGYAEKVDIRDVKATSYHENGEVDLIKVKKGHVEIEPTSQVLGVYVYNDSTETEKDDSFENIKITIKSGADTPQLSRSAVAIDSTNGTKVCTIVTDEAKDIYLFQQGVYEQIKTVDEGKNINTDASASWADDVSKNNDTTQAAAQQLANEINATFEVNDVTYSVEIVDREVVVINTATSEQVSDPTIIEEAVDQSGKDESEAAGNLGLFGKGTQDNPFLVYNYATMQKISNYYTDGYYYYEVAIERTEDGIIDCAEWTPVKLHGSFNGNGVKFTNLDKHLFAAIVGVTTDGSSYSGNAGFYAGSAESFNNSTPIVVENFTIEAQIKGTAVAAGVAHSVGTNITFRNINVNGYIEGYTASGIANYGAYQFGDDPSRNPEYKQFLCNLTFDNCNVSATLVALNEGTAGLIQHPYSNGSSVWTINNCTINAEMYATNYNNAPRTYLYNYQQPATTLVIDGVETHVTSSIKYTGMKAHTLIYNSPALAAPANKGDNFTIAATNNASYAMFGLIISPNPGSMTATYINERVELNGNSFTSNLIKYCDVKINSVNAAPGYNEDFTIYNVNSTAFNGTSNGQYVQVVQYAADGSILSISTCNLSLISQ